MKKTIIASAVLILVLACPLIAKGTIGIRMGYRAFLDNKWNLASQGFNLTVSGTNSLNPTDTFGVEYSISKPFMYNKLMGTSCWSFGARLYARFRPIERLNLSAYAGLSCETIKKTDIASLQIGPSIAAGIGYEVSDNFMASAMFEYSTTTLKMYGTTVKSAWFSDNIIACSLSASYIY